MIAKLAAPFAFAVAVLAASPAVQAAVPDQSSITVRFGDLDLATTAGQATLKARLHEAADTLCGGRHGLAETGAYRAYHSCVNKAEGSVMPQIRDAIAAARPSDKQPQLTEN